MVTPSLTSNAGCGQRGSKSARGLLQDRLPVGPIPDQPGGLSFSAVEFIAELGALSEQQRACVVLTHVGLLGPTDIAAVLGTTPNTVSVQLHRAHEALRRTHSAVTEEGQE